VRIFCPTAPFSTISPSGRSLMEGGVPIGLLLQNVLPVVQ
jgi:hypothetical protein